MLTNRSYWTGRHLPLLSPDNDGGGPAGPSGATAATAATGESGPTGSGEKGDDKEALKRMGEQRDAAREEARRVAEERDALLKEKNDLAAADQKRKDDEAAASGKWEELAKKREGELKSAKDEAAALQARNDQLQTALENGLATSWAALPEEVRKQGEELISEDDVLLRFEYLHKPSTQALVAKLTDKAETSRGNGPNPKPGGTGTRSVEDEAKALNQSGSYAM